MALEETWATTVIVAPKNIDYLLWEALLTAERSLFTYQESNAD